MLGRRKFAAAVLIGTLGHASSALARDFIFDGAPLGEVVKAVGTKMGAQVRVCSGGDRPVSGRFNFEDAASIAPMLMEKGFPVASGPSGSIEVGCDAAAQEQAGAVVPAFNGAIGASSSAPAGAPAAAPAPPPPPPVYARVDLRYRDPSKILAAVSKLPGLSVLSFPDVPGPMLLAGPASIVREAKDFIAALDTCPAQVRVEALVVTKGEQVRRDRRFGVRIGSGDTVLGTDDASAPSMFRVPGLSAFLAAMRERGEFRTNRSFIGDVVLGGTVALRDGSEIPVQAGTIITDRETRNNVSYRDVGHNLSFSLLAMADGYAVVNLNHEISSLVGNSSLGPTFAKQSTESIVRLRLGAWEMISLSGTDTAERTKSRGIFSRSDATSSERNGAYLVFSLAAVPCTPLTAGEYVEPARQGGVGRGELHEAGKRGKRG